MPRLLLSKATLAKERQQLQVYRKFLPSLELKRQQLMLAVRSVDEQVLQLQEQLTELEARVVEQLPMLALEQPDLAGLCRVSAIRYQRRNLVGVWIQELEQVEFVLAPLPLMASPHWVAVLQQWLQQAIRIQLEVRLARDNQAVLAAALRKVTQRVNLFDKVLIPGALDNIRTIQIWLDDKAREAVVASKLAKNKQAQAAGSSS